MFPLVAASVAMTGPTQVSVSYVTTFDLGAMAERACAQGGLCDCTVRYEGTGTLVDQAEGRLTFQGTWAIADGRCHDALMLWVPADGEAFHTLRVADNVLTEWIAHDAAGDTTRKTRDIKAGGQVYLHDFAALMTDGAAIHSESDQGKVGPMMLKSTHSLTVKLQ